MHFIKPDKDSCVRLKLVRDHSRRIKQGFPWIYDQWLAELPEATPGSRALVRSKQGELLAFGMYDPKSPLAVRVCALEAEQLDDKLIASRLESALDLRRRLFDDNTTGFRLINGEGDGLPGLVCDVYSQTAVLKLDGAGPRGFWDIDSIAQWLIEHAGMRCVYEKNRAGSGEAGRILAGSLDSPVVRFLEHGVTFQTNIVEGQKSGFFLDQRDNRARIGKLSRGLRVLNMFGYTGGFSVYAGRGGAAQVTTVDLAKPAIEEAERNWQLNDLVQSAHRGVAMDAFEFLAQARAAKEWWDLVIVDPPSFASAAEQVERASASYTRVFAEALAVLKPGGIAALSSCSSHITPEMFYEICQGAFSERKRRGVVIGAFGQPEDHPFPLACRELQYLKFLLFRAS